MDVKEIVKKMLEKGMTREQVKNNLVELGFENADELINSTAPPQPQKPKSLETEAQEAPENFMEDVFDKKTGNEKTGAGDEEGKNLFKEEPPSEELFGGAKPPAKEEPAKENELPEPEEREVPDLKITSISEGGEEKEVNIQSMLSEAGVETSDAHFTKAQENAIKSKLDESIALLKALQDINKKILDTDKEVLMRLKKTG